jgi:hypothetical protein
MNNGEMLNYSNEIIMFIILVISIGIALKVKGDVQWHGTGGREIFPKEHQYDLTMKCLATFLLFVILGVDFGVITTSPIKSKDLVMVLFSPFLIFPCLVILTAKEFADKYVIPLCKLIFLLMLTGFVLTLYLSLFEAISTHQLPRRYGKTYLEKDFMAFWITFLGMTFIGGLFLNFVKEVIITFYKKVSSK